MSYMLFIDIEQFQNDEMRPILNAWMQGERKTNTYFANAKLTELIQAITENVGMVSRALSQITRVHLFECFQCKSLIILISVFFVAFVRN